MYSTCRQGTVQAVGGSVMVLHVQLALYGTLIRLDTTLTCDREKRLESDRRHHQKQGEFESQEQHVTRVTEQSDRSHESQGQRMERLAQLRESLSSGRNKFGSRKASAYFQTSALRDIESEENR
ncbi:hypothetical protein TNCV_3249881 [Trichonephila clavipes]|nr:hypothetical protein TNCV_3249881 [Trichonephila clavipes]